VNFVNFVLFVVELNSHLSSLRETILFHKNPCSSVFIRGLHFSIPHSTFPNYLRALRPLWLIDFFIFAIDIGGVLSHDCIAKQIQ
jgi:hypothetical protein